MKIQLQRSYWVDEVLNIKSEDGDQRI